MKYCIFLGGLGNQMFQYAFCVALREKGHKVKIDLSYYDYYKMHNGYELERVFGIKEDYISESGVHMLWLRILNRFFPSYLCSDDREYSTSKLINPKKYLFGYWQNENYFSGVKPQLRSLFKFRNIDPVNLGIADQMDSVESVSLHIRRGDYVDCGIDLMDEIYYQNAILKIKEMTSNPIFYIFSDDAVAAERMASKMGIHYQLIQHNKGRDSYKDMFLMSKCHHNIIANSSFSWWGAWLNTNANKIVIAPKIWLSTSPSLRPQSKDWILV